MHVSRYSACVTTSTTRLSCRLIILTITAYRIFKFNGRSHPTISAMIGGCPTTSTNKIVNRINQNLLARFKRCEKNKMILLSPIKKSSLDTPINKITPAAKNLKHDVSLLRFVIMVKLKGRQKFTAKNGNERC